MGQVRLLVVYARQPSKKVLREEPRVLPILNVEPLQVVERIQEAQECIDLARSSANPNTFESPRARDARDECAQ